MTHIRQRREPDPFLADRVVARLVALVTGLTPSTARAAMEAARVTAPVSLWALEDHLSAHGITPASSGPLQLLKLFAILDIEGYDLPPTACAACDRRTRVLPHRQDDGRICTPCAHRRYVRRCEICKEIKRITHAGTQTGICGNCRRRNPDPERVGPCTRCGRVQRLIICKDDGSLRCQRCQAQGRALRACVDCGALARTQKITDAGPVCPACYRERHRPRRVCGRCGRSRLIDRRATTDQPDLCNGCYRGAEGTCSRCGRFRPGRKTPHGGFRCEGCLPRPLRQCAGCQRRRTVQAVWPIGPVCSSCYNTIRKHPARCPNCAETRVLTGTDAGGARICGPCAGARDYTCTGCGRAGHTYADQRCAWCVLDERVSDLLTEDHGTIAAQLRPLRAALTNTDRPESVLTWIRRPRTRTLFAFLAAHPDNLSHELLDKLPATQHLHYLRKLLVLADVLPARDEHLERTRTWLNQTLTELPSEHRQFVQPFGLWHVLHRARRRSHQFGPRTAQAAAKDRRYIHTAAAFLAWLDTHSLTLATINQQHIDQWIDTGPAARHLRPFIKWTNQRRLTTALDVPNRPSTMPSRFLTDEQRWTQLRRCLDDTTMPTNARVAGALVLLFGITLTRMLNLTTTDVTFSKDVPTGIRFGKQPIPLPPKVAAIVATLINDRDRPASIPALSHHEAQMLFPGRPATTPITLQALSRTLTRNGITAHLGRNAAMLDLAADIPAAVLADLLGMSAGTTHKWNRLTSRDWTHYLEARTDTR